MAAHNDLGHWGEDKAAEYLIGKGYSIMDRNWKLGKRDLDIVATKDGEIVFVEVKTRRNNDFMMPQQAVDWRKARSLSYCIKAYLNYHRLNMRFHVDIIAITGTNDENITIDHIENVRLTY